MVPGDVAPFEGQLVTTELAIELAVSSSSAAAREAADRKRDLEKQKADLELKFAKERNGLKADLQIANAEKAMLQKAYDNKGASFWTIATAVVLTAATIYGSAWAYGQVK